MPWPFSRERAEEPASERERAQDRLEPIRVSTREAEFRGFVRASDERLTDVLQRGEDLSILPIGAADEPSSWVQVSPAEVQLVVPPPHVSPPERRLVRQPREVVVRVGSYELSGTAHLMPGAEQDVLARSSHPFLPLTDVALYAEGATEPERLDVVIVNLRETSEYRVV